MRVVIADDHQQVRSAMRLLLEQMPGVEIGEVSRTGLTSCFCCPADILLLDWDFLRKDAPKVISSLRVTHSGTALIVLDTNPETRRSALEAGADGFVCKNDPPEKLIEVLQAFNGRKQ